VWIVANLRCGGLDQGNSSLSGQESGEAFSCNTNRDVTNTESRETFSAESGGFHAESCGTDSDVADPDRFNGHDARHDAGEISQFQKAEIFRGEFNTDTTSIRSEPWRAEHEGQKRDASPIINSWDEPWIEAATRLCRVDDGISRRVDNTGRIPIKSKKKNTSGRIERLKSLGNAIVPQVAYEIMKAIRSINEP
jgi:hypothetical protein